MTKPRMAALTVLSLAAYLGLAIAGAGGAARFFSHPPLIAVTVVTIALGLCRAVQRGPYRRWRQGGSVQSLGGRRSQRARRPRRLSAGLYGPDRFPHLRQRRGALARRSPLYGRRRSSPRAGLRARAPLQRTGCDPARTPAGHQRALRNHSPPKLSRSLRSHAWLGVAFRSGVGVVIAVLWLGVLLARIQAEERLLGETFGAEYDAYRARTWRLIPYVY